ncbi:ATP-binding cassette domain-containing protein [Treponema sp. OMZ 840]|uniref:ATP-binding cassette domain-containing protein n=1 Tax=Treponema sp. OMZ 840 TaxID=244313 RepID=UPI003D93E24B
MTTTPYKKSFIKLDKIQLKYGSVEALTGIDLIIRPGEIHALVGEHGAGKSTIVSIISGEITADEGSIFLNEKRMGDWSIKQALQNGIKTVYQQIPQNENFTVAESLYYTNKAVNSSFWISKRKMHSAAEKMLHKNGFNLSPSRLIKTLNLSERTIVEILRCLSTDTKLLIIDEGLDNLSTDFYNKIINILKQYKSKGMAVLCITHKIDDVYLIADKVSIIRNGTILITDKTYNIDKMSLIRLTYTQISKENAEVISSKGFYEFLKYNEAIIKKLPLSLIVISKDKKIRLLNDMCRSMFSWNTTHIGKNINDCLPKQNKILSAFIDEVISKTGEKRLFHVCLSLSDKQIITNVQSHPITDAKKTIGYIITIEDVTEQEQLQKQVILSEKLASVGMLAAGVAHEINNPLEIIYNYLTFLRYNYDNEKLLSIVEKISDEILNISAIVSNLVSFSDKKTAHNELLDLNELCKDIINLIKFNANYKYIDLIFLEGTDTLRIEANKNEIRQVILNLLKNSIEAMPNGGNVIIKTLKKEINKKPYTELHIIDEGEGLIEADIQNIFMPFYSKKLGKENNMGLGLSICYSIIEKYHGILAAHNNQIKGCTFIVSLPAAI